MQGHSVFRTPSIFLLRAGIIYGKYVPDQKRKTPSNLTSMEYTNFNGFLALLSANTLLPLALIIPPSTLSHTKLAVAFLPLIWSCNAFAWKCNLGFFAAAHAFLSTNFLLFRRPREDFKLLRLKSPAQSQASARKVDEKDNENAEEKESPIFKEPYPNTFWKRLWWVNKLVNSLRYVGWDTGEDKPPAVLPSPETWTAKGCWLVRKAVFIAICFAVFDATNFYQHFDPYFQSGTDIDEQLPRRLATFLSRCYLHFLSPRAVRILIVGVQQYVIFSVMGIILAIPPILLGGLGILDDFWSGTYNWQPIMGNPLVVLDSGLRGFWGKFWHQLFRSVSIPLQYPDLVADRDRSLSAWERPSQHC